MEWKRENYSRTGIYLLTGIGLAGLALIAPDGGKLGSLDFLTEACAGSWLEPLDWRFMWYSFKVIVFSLGIFFTFDALATWARLFGFVKLSFLFLIFLTIPSIGSIYGGYCLLKAIL